jgi:sugar O-acyltransferase (sialic acid O-acetyltransferase NeuD family)
MSKPVYIVGAGGHARAVMNLILPDKRFQITGILDDSYDKNKEEFINDIRVIDALNHNNSYKNLVLGIGDLAKRTELFSTFNAFMLKENLIHSSAYIEPRVSIGESNQIFAKVYINSNTSIGNNNIINTGAVLEHENIIGNHNHISIGVLMGGHVTIGSNCFIGAGATIIDKITICNNVNVGANSTVIQPITEPGTYVGNPVRKVK